LTSDLSQQKKMKKEEDQIIAAEGKNVRGGREMVASSLRAFWGEK
jgi:hypothetical protein